MVESCAGRIGRSERSSESPAILGTSISDDTLWNRHFNKIHAKKAPRNKHPAQGNDGQKGELNVKHAWSLCRKILRNSIICVTSAYWMIDFQSKSLWWLKSLCQTWLKGAKEFIICNYSVPSINWNLLGWQTKPCRGGVAPPVSFVTAYAAGRAAQRRPYRRAGNFPTNPCLWSRTE